MKSNNILKDKVVSVEFETKVDAELILDSLDSLNNKLIKQAVSDNSKKIFGEIVDKIESVNFRKYTGIEKLQKKHYLVSIIEIFIKRIEQLGYDVRMHNGSFFLYNGFYWVKIDDFSMKNILGKVALKMKLNKFDAKLHQFKDELYKQFQSEIEGFEEQQNNDKTLINLLNGTFEITETTQKLRPFNKNDFITYQLPFSYDEKKEAPIFMEFLNRVLPDKTLQIVLAEYLGYVFVKNNVLSLEKVLLLYGSGANGKSVLFNIVNALLGKENVSNYTLQSLTNNSGYERAMIGDKLLNYASEINGKMETHFFKLLISGEPVQVRLPYGMPFIMTNYAKFIFNTNVLPQGGENTHAFYRRFIIIPFKETIPVDEQDINLANKIIRNELSGVFNWILLGLKNLLKQQTFTMNEIVKIEIEKFKRESNSILMFIDEENYKASTNETKSLKELYFEYKTYCNDNGYRVFSKKNFSKQLQEAGFVKERMSYGNVFFIRK